VAQAGHYLLSVRRGKLLGGLMQQESKDIIRGLIKAIAEAITEIDDLEPRTELRDDVAMQLEDLQEDAENILRMM